MVLRRKLILLNMNNQLKGVRKGSFFYILYVNVVVIYGKIYKRGFKQDMFFNKG